MKSKTFNSLQLRLIFFSFVIMFAITFTEHCRANYYQKCYKEEVCFSKSLFRDYIRALDTIEYQRHVIEVYETNNDSLNLIIQANESISIVGWE